MYRNYPKWNSGDNLFSCAGSGLPFLLPKFDSRYFDTGGHSFLLRERIRHADVQEKNKHRQEFARFDTK
ncbi:MAG: hypothetical protein JWR72_123 [Flavisolibacter sp.]|nr:hypothetical protein [Flavisolibacter sp.]